MLSVFLKFLSKNKYLLFILGLFVLISGLLLNPDLPMENDEPYYFVLAKSLSLQKGYVHLYYPGEGLVDVEYPPLYPICLALIMKLVEYQVVFLKILSLLFGGAALIAVYIFFTRKNKTSFLPETKQSFYLWLLFFTATNWWFLSFSVIIAPEIAYLFFSLAALYFLEKYNQQTTLINKYLFGAILLLIMTFYTKTLGLALIIAAVIYFLWIERKYKKGLVLGGISLGLISPWLLKNSLITNADKVISQNYLNQFFFGYEGNLWNIIKTVGLNIFNYGKAIAHLLLPGYFMGESMFEGLSYSPFFCSLMNNDRLFKPQVLPVVSFFIIVFFCGMTIFGFIRQLIKKKSLMEIYILCYLGIIMIFPSCFYINAGKRYLVSLLPFILYYFFRGIFFVEKWRLKIQEESLKTGNNKKGFLYFSNLWVISGIVLLLGNLIPDFWSVKGNISYLADYKVSSEKEKRNYHSFWLNDYFTLAEWIKKNTPPDAVLMHFFPAAFYLHTERKVTFFDRLPYYPEERNFNDIKADIEKRKVGYIITGSSKQEEIVSWLNIELSQYVFIPIAEIEVNRVYKAFKVNSLIKEKYKQGAFWYKEGKYDLAIAEFRKAQAIVSTFVGYFNLGRCYEEKGEREKAQKMYKQAVVLQPDFKVGKIRADILFYQQLIDVQPHNYQHYYQLGKSFLESYQYDKAIDNFSGALALNPSFYQVHYFLGLSYLGNKDYREAIMEFKKALILTPEIKYKTKHYLKIARKLRKRNK
ncbi:tetratricopeptide repeat protein [bacterium]|nr:tetratricopeptide repeat protein [bacterium]